MTPTSRRASAKTASAPTRPRAPRRSAARTPAEGSAVEPTAAAALPPAPARPQKPAPSAKPGKPQKPAGAASEVKPVKPAKPAKAVKPAKPVKATKPPKVRPQLVRDGFTMPEADFGLIATLKARALAAQRVAKKSELLRAGLHALHAMDTPALLAALERLEPVKIGRPKSGR
jgi:hypothetical protein